MAVATDERSTKSIREGLLRLRVQCEEGIYNPDPAKVTAFKALRARIVPLIEFCRENDI